MKRAIIGLGITLAIGSPLITITVAQEVGKLSPSELRRVEALVSENRPPGAVKICDAVVVLQGERPSIVAALDFTGRRFCNQIVRIAMDGAAIRVLDEIEAFQVNDVSTIVRDLDRDGRPELVIPQPVSPYEGGTRCQAVVPVVYSCTAQSCTDVSQDYKQFYLEQIDERWRGLAIPGDPDEDAHSGRLQCLAMERDKMLRLIGSDPHAGFETAEKWMGSSDPIIRRKAISVFSDINDQESRRNLERLARDPDSIAREHAIAALKRRF